MLDIANYGHQLGRSRRKRAYEEPILNSENVTPPMTASRKRAESISSRERASIYIDPDDDDVTGRVLDEMPLTDIEGEETDYERETRYPSDPAARLASVSKYDYSHTAPDLSHEQMQLSPVTPVAQTIPNYSHPHIHQSHTLPANTRQYPRQQQQQQLQQPSRRRGASVTQKGSAPPDVITTSSSIPSTQSSPEQRGRPNVPSNRSKGPTQAKGQKRSKSAGDVLRSPTGGPQLSEMGDYDALADAIPDTRVPVPKTGNWDDVSNIFIFTVVYTI